MYENTKSNKNAKLNITNQLKYKYTKENFKNIITI